MRGLNQLNVLIIFPICSLTTICGTDQTPGISEIILVLALCHSYKSVTSNIGNAFHLDFRALEKSNIYKVLFWKIITLHELTWFE